MRKLSGLGCFGGLLLLIGILVGCSLFLPNDQTEDSSDTPELLGTSTWLIAAQGQGGPPACVGTLPPGQAKKLAEKALKDKPEVQLLKQALERRGKKLVLSKTHGCKVKSKVKGQGLIAQQESTIEATLVEVPAGSDAALYLIENETAGEGNYWASLKGSEEGGQWLTHLEAGITSNDTTPSDPAGANLFLPDDVGIQEIAGQVQQLLADASTQGQGLKALQVAVELDWSQAQVVLLDAETDEATAILTIPPISTTGQIIWPGGGGSMDTARAVNTAVKVQRQVNPVNNRAQWKVLPVEFNELPIVLPKPNPPAPKLPAPKPQPPTTPPPPKPVVKAGSELPDAFSYCPYQYYGKVTTLQRTLCRDSWRQWYSKQWASNAVQNKVLQASGAAASQGLYNIAYARDGKRGIDLLAAGFDNLNSSDLQKLLDHVASLSQIVPTVQPPQDILQRWDQARPLFDAISTEQLISWFTTLSQALQQGNFDQVYQQLLAQGLGQLEQAIMTLNGTDDPTIAKSNIIEGVKAWSSLEARLMQLPQDVRDRIDQLMREAFDHLVRALIPDQLRYTYGQLSLTFTGILGRAIGAICGQFSPACSEAMKYLLRNIENKSPYQVITELMALWDDMIWGFQGDAKAVEALSRALNTIINTFTWDGNALNYTTQLVAFLDWVRDWRSANRGSNDMFEQALGTLMVAGNSLRQGWTYYGLRADKGGAYGSFYDIWWAGVLYLSPDKLPPNNNGRGIMVVERGDNCTDCAAKSEEIVAWIGRAVEMLPSIQGNLTNIDPNSIGVVTFAFTNPNAQGIDTVLQKLRTQYASSQVPIIVSWLENNIVHFECIGAGCESLTWEEQEKIACNQQGAPAGCTDWGTPVPSGPYQPTPLTIGSPPPPPDKCFGQVCIQRVRL